MSAPALAAENLNAWYGAAQVLYDVSFTIGRGEVVALMGRNGAGKSTTMKAVMGLMARRSGVVRVNGHDVSRLRPFEIARLGVGFVPEDRRIFSDLTVDENLDTGRQPPRRFEDGAEAPNWTLDALFRLFPNLAELRARPGARMSGGEQQMLTIARTLMGNPDLLLLDEPSEGLAPLVVDALLAKIADLKAHGLTILLAEQGVDFSLALADRVYVLEKGAVRFTGAAAELRSDRALLDRLMAV